MAPIEDTPLVRPAVVLVGIVVLFGSIAFAAYRYHGKPHLDSDDAGAVTAGT